VTHGLLLVTGAAGKIATMLRPALADAGLSVRLSDARPVRPLLPNESFVRARLERPRQMRRACDGAAALLHLGGVSIEQDWDALIAANVTGLTTTFEAARAAGIGRIVFASTMHVLGMYSRTEAIDETCAPAPDTRYAVTKLLGEGTASLYAAKYGLAVTALRIGHAVPEIADAAPGEGIAAADMARLVLLALSFETPGYRLLHAVAPHPGYPTSDGRLATQHGFVFQQEGPDYPAILARLEESSLNARARALRGGYFAGL
jgi:uronate dehydrogenase